MLLLLVLVRVLGVVLLLLLKLLLLSCSCCPPFPPACQEVIHFGQPFEEELHKITGIVVGVVGENHRRAAHCLN